MRQNLHLRNKWTKWFGLPPDVPLLLGPPADWRLEMNIEEFGKEIGQFLNLKLIEKCIFFVVT
jgi:hypothetical protein